MEDLATAERVRSDPALFLEDHGDKVWFDEAHRVPELFSALRVAVDQDRRAGRYVLSGSASGPLLSQVSESLAGRAGLLHLRPLSAAELEDRPSPGFLAEILQADTAKDLLEKIKEEPRRNKPDGKWFRGGFPEPALAGKPIAWRRWYDSYLTLVSERDLGRMHDALRPQGIRRLLRLLAARQGSIINASALGRDFGVSSQTLSRFLDYLEVTHLFWRQEAWQQNLGKRIIKSPKGWLCDTGLLHALLDLRHPADLDIHPLAGMSFESWVIQQLRVQADAQEQAPRFYHWRTQAGAEVDLVLEHGGHLIPVEIKRRRRLSPYDLRGIKSFSNDFADEVPFGLIIHRAASPTRIQENIVSVPLECAV